MCTKSSFYLVNLETENSIVSGVTCYETVIARIVLHNLISAVWKHYFHKNGNKKGRFHFLDK